MKRDRLYHCTLLLSALNCFSVALQSNHGAIFSLSPSRLRDGVSNGPNFRISRVLLRSASNDNNGGMDDLLVDSSESQKLAETSQFGEVVVPRYLQNTTDAALVSEESTAVPSSTESGWSKNIVVAIASISLAVLQYAWQFSHPVAPLALLSEMQERSAPLSVIGNNGKPTVVDFWAPWCENCKLIAPTLYQLEGEYEGKVNFCMVNGDLRAAWPAIEAFGVDAIPHMALVEADGTVDTALVGPVPSRILRADLDTLLSNAAKKSSQAAEGDASSVAPDPLPYTMLDVFQDRPDSRKVRFD